jgi:hypothetical protein
VWRNAMAGGAGADGNDDGVVDAHDYGVWRSNYGSSLAVGGAAGSAGLVSESLAIGIDKERGRQGDKEIDGGERLVVQPALHGGRLAGGEARVSRMSDVDSRRSVGSRLTLGRNVDVDWVREDALVEWVRLQGRSAGERDLNLESDLSRSAWDAAGKSEIDAVDEVFAWGELDLGGRASLRSPSLPARRG